MPRHDQSSLRVQQRAWFGLILVAAALVVASPVFGQDSTGAASAAAPPVAREPIDLAGRSVRTWRQDQEQWVLLVGFGEQPAAVMRGVEGLRAQEIVVRLRTTPTTDGVTYQLDVYAEGVASLPGQTPKKTARLTLQTDEPPRLTPYDQRGLRALNGPPTEFGSLARSGFLSASSPTAERRAVPSPSSVSSQRTVNPSGSAVEAQPSAGSILTPVAASLAPPGVVELPDASPSPTPTPETQATRQARKKPTGRPAPTDPLVTTTQYIQTKPTAPAARPAAAAPAGELPDVVEAPATGDNAQGGDSLPQVVESPMTQRGSDELPDAVEVPGGARGEGELPPAAEASELETAPTVPLIPDGPERGRPATDLAPLPDSGDEPTRVLPPSRSRIIDEQKKKNPFTPIFPGSQRITIIAPRNSSPNFDPQRLPTANGMDIMVIRGGVNIVTRSQQFGEIDISADNAVIWRRIAPDGGTYNLGPNGEQIEDAHAPMEFYLEGNVVLRQDEKKVAGNGDQRVYRAERVYYDVLYDRAVVLDAELDMFAPGLVAPAKVKSPRMDQFRPLEMAANGTWVYGLQQIRADRTTTTGSRFPNPGYRMNSRAIDITRIKTKQANPNTGKTVGDDSDPNAPEDLTWLIDARQNIFRMGRVPVFYWPRVLLETDDLEPPIRQLSFGTTTYFGQQVLVDFNGFRLIGKKKPKFIDLWNVDLDYLSYRTKQFPALGTEIGWFGNDLLNDLADPYREKKGQPPSITNDYFGYFDIWGLHDSGKDDLGPGPAIITSNIADGKAGFTRGTGGPSTALNGVPILNNPRGRLNFRHMQRFLPDDLEHEDEDLRLQLEVGGYTDRYFLEEYYKRLYDTGIDQETLLYGVRQKQNWAYSIWTEANLLSWETETQWLPKLDYFRLGDSLFNDWFTYFQHTGVDYASTHTASEVNNPNIFAFIPYDPISNTSGTLNSGRGYTNHEIDLKLDIGRLQEYIRIVPFLQGQVVGWTNQIDGQSMGRVWGAYGLRADMTAYRVYPSVQSELFNVHGLNHKIDFEAEYRNAVSNVNLDRIGVQDDLDDNSYETVRRYFALTNYAGGILPMQYDPRLLILRRGISPITGTTDIQASMQTLHMGIHQRLQTKRGPDGKRKIMDYMTLDLDTTYFPNSNRDNFGKPFGQNMYNWQWFVGDRTSLVSYGWFEFWNITGNPIYKTNTNHNDNPFGLNVITSGINLNRPPRGSVFLGYTIVNTGPIATSAPVTTISYWLSPKWFGSTSLTYDFGNHILLAAMGSLTRIGADYLTSLGVTVDPQRQSWTFAVTVSPRLGSTMRTGSAMMTAFDPRYAPTQ